MSMHFIMAQHICIQVNRIKLNLNNCWLSHGAIEMMLTSATTLTGMGRSNWVYCHASGQYLNLGKVMGACYPDQVGGA